MNKELNITYHKEHYIIHNVMIANDEDWVCGEWPYNRFLKCTEESVDLTLIQAGLCFVYFREYDVGAAGVVSNIVIKGGRVYADLIMKDKGVRVYNGQKITIDNTDYDVMYDPNKENGINPKSTSHMISKWMLRSLTIGVEE